MKSPMPIEGPPFFGFFFGALGLGLGFFGFFFGGMVTV